MIRTGRILVVDDEESQLKAVCETLRDHGYYAVAASEPNAALALLEQHQFDLLLTDLAMPDLDGIALFQRALTTDPDLVSVIMTGSGTIKTAVEAMQVGALDYVLKPFRASALLAVVSRALTVRTLRIDNAALVQRVADRTAALEAANRELESFSYSVSHDLRAPLRAIAGFAQALSEAATPDESSHLVRRIAANVERMNQLIEALLELSQVGRRQLDKAPIQLTSLVREVVVELTGEEAGSRVVVEPLPDALGDGPLLRQVFVNLLMNALKFTRGTACPKIEVGHLIEADSAVYYVRDNGAGFDMAYADRMFGPFQRLHRQDEFEGTGIGLSITRRIIERHGGRIWAEAQVGEGATFYLTLSALASEPE
ncbi:MAG TPA: response regulator [Polyangiaceae bacterium]|jgi:hypothetical protein|nr:response regulator [Polyangiaceae bacterium]